MKNYPIHERLLVGSLLAMAAGGLDAYTYLEHGEVFAGLQTGNFILLGIHLTKDGLSRSLHYLVPIAAFALGTILIRILQQGFEKNESLKNRQLFVLGWEILLIWLTALVAPVVPDMLASAMVSLAAAAQLQEFRKLKGGPFTSLMMTGNLRTLAESYWNALSGGNRGALKKGNDTLAIVVAFVFGAALTGNLAERFGERTVLVSSVFLLIAAVIIFQDQRKQIITK